MKNFLFLILFFSVVCSAYAQDSFKQATEQQVRSMLCHKWKLAYMEGKGKKVNVADKVKLLLDFLPDGVLKVTANKDHDKGTWKYQHDKFLITTNDKDGIENYTLGNITKDLLVMKTKIKGIAVSMGFKQVD